MASIQGIMCMVCLALASGGQPFTGTRRSVSTTDSDNPLDIHIEPSTLYEGTPNILSVTCTLKAANDVSNWDPVDIILYKQQSSGVLEKIATVSTFHPDSADLTEESNGHAFGHISNEWDSYLCYSKDVATPDDAGVYVCKADVLDNDKGMLDFSENATLEYRTPTVMEVIQVLKDDLNEVKQNQNVENNSIRQELQDLTHKNEVLSEELERINQTNTDTQLQLLGLTDSNKFLSQEVELLHQANEQAREDLESWKMNQTAVLSEYDQEQQELIDENQRLQVVIGSLITNQTTVMSENDELREEVNDLKTDHSHVVDRIERIEKELVSLKEDQNATSSKVEKEEEDIRRLAFADGFLSSEVFNGKQYHVSKTIFQNIEIATNTCRAVGGELAVFEDYDELHFAQTFVHRVSILNEYTVTVMGITDADYEGYWVSMATGEHVPDFGIKGNGDDHDCAGFSKMRNSFQTLVEAIYCSALAIEPRRYFMCQTTALGIAPAW